MEATFCFVDIAGFTALTETHGAETAADVVERFTGLAEQASRDDGEVVDRTGDALFVASPTPGQALAFLSRLFAVVSDEPDFPVLRAGLHHGEAVARAGSYYGAAVNLAARVAAQAGGGQVLGTAEIAAAARTLGLDVATLGAVALRNVRDPVEIFAIELATDTGVDAAIDPVCRMHVDRQRAPARVRFAGKERFFCSVECAKQFLERPEAYVDAGR
jgi:adenylate cyclase